MIDCDGRLVGRVSDTYPADGGGEVELVLVDVGVIFPRRRWLPLGGCIPLGDETLLVNWRRWQIEDAPDAADRRWGEPADIARAYWLIGDD